MCEPVPSGRGRSGLPVSYQQGDPRSDRRKLPSHLSGRSRRLQGAKNASEPTCLAPATRAQPTPTTVHGHPQPEMLPHLPAPWAQPLRLEELQEAPEAREPTKQAPLPRDTGQAGAGPLTWIRRGPTAQPRDEGGRRIPPLVPAARLLYTHTPLLTAEKQFPSTLTFPKPLALPK